MIKKISFFCLIAIVISIIHFNEGCKIEIFTPTPTPTPTPTLTPTVTPTEIPTLTPTITPTPTPNKVMIQYFKDAKKIIDNFKNIKSSETKIFYKLFDVKNLCTGTITDQDVYDIYKQFFDELAKQENLINNFKKKYPKDYIPTFTPCIELEMLYFRDAERMLSVLGDNNIKSTKEIWERHQDLFMEVTEKYPNDNPFDEAGKKDGYMALCTKGEECDDKVNILFNQGIINCSMGQYFYK